jgi:ABC transporter with metal-binding/Fe-S-binding domain ATP-binding protein
MNFAGLFSGGKDSTFAISELIRQGHKLTCLITMEPISDDSMLFHYPCIRLIKKISKVINVPIIDVQCSSPDKEYESNQLQRAIYNASSLYPIEGISHGCISSNFQLHIINDICREFNLTMLSPVWHIDTDFYFNQLFDQKFEIIITRVAASGLDKSWLGKTIDGKNYLKLRELSKRYGFNLTFEGGEAETLVLDCPMYKKKVVVKDSAITWDGVRGIFEISEVDLIEK